MAHELEFVNGEAAMAYVGEVPWHGLGVQVNPDISPIEMLKVANLDWTVDKIPLYGTHNDKEVFSGRYGLARSNDSQILTVISDDWEPVQNIEAFEFFNEFIEAGDMEMHTAGSLRNGNMVWALAKVKDSFSLFGGEDTVESYLLFSNPHEYGKSIDIRFTPIRVVCNNTLTLSLSKKSDMMVRLNHRRKFDPEMAKSVLGVAHTKLSDYKEMATFLSSKRYTQENLVQYMDKIFPMTTPVKEEKKWEAANDTAPKIVKISRPGRIALDVIETQPGAKFGEGSWWQAFNAVTYSIDHLLGHNNATRLNSSWYGPNRDKKLKALETAVEYANAA